MSILLVDDHKMLRDGLRALLEKEGIPVVGEAATGREAVEKAHLLCPSVVVMDISMPDLNGIEATRRIVAQSPGIKVIGLSVNADRRYVSALLAAGAVGYLLKNCAAEELLKAVSAVTSGQTYVSAEIAGSVTSLKAAPVSTPLTQREREVLQLLAEGCASKDIAARLSISLPTVETHRRNIMTKLQLHTVAELTKYAIREGITGIEG